MTTDYIVFEHHRGNADASVALSVAQDLAEQATTLKGSQDRMMIIPVQDLSTLFKWDGSVDSTLPEKISFWSESAMAEFAPPSEVELVYVVPMAESA